MLRLKRLKIDVLFRVLFIIVFCCKYVLMKHNGAKEINYPLPKHVRGHIKIEQIEVLVQLSADRANRLVHGVVPALSFQEEEISLTKRSLGGVQIQLC